MPTNTNEILPVKTRLLIDYMILRAEHEKCAWGFPDWFTEAYFDKGMRNFFGVSLDNGGNLLGDHQQPAFFEAFKIFFPISHQKKRTIRSRGAASTGQPRVTTRRRAGSSRRGHSTQPRRHAAK